MELWNYGTKFLKIGFVLFFIYPCTANVILLYFLGNRLENNNIPCISSLIFHRYCNRLPSDPFTHLTPRCKVFELPSDSSTGLYEEFPMSNGCNVYQCTLQLPINSHIQKPVKVIHLLACLGVIFRDSNTVIYTLFINTQY